MAEYSPMMQHYLQTKNIKIAFYFIVWAIFMKCFLMMQLQLQEN